MGFPVIAVTETSTGIKVRQDRFLEEGPAKPEDNETLWYVLILILINPYGIMVLEGLYHWV